MFKHPFLIFSFHVGNVFVAFSRPRRAGPELQGVDQELLSRIMNRTEQYGAGVQVTANVLDEELLGGSCFFSFR